MSQINLLPWRETLRRAQLREFLCLFMLVLALVVALSIGLHLALRHRLKQQQKANQYLIEQRHLLVPQLKQINLLKKQRQQLIDSIQMIHLLQRQQQQSILILIDIAKAVPQRIYLDKIIYHNNIITMSGYANDNNAITVMNQQLMQSSLFKDINLAEVRASTKQGLAHYFTITLGVSEISDET